ncbi:unnamed protein product [Mesocestoides corti]|uniref:MRH domain-containing protein n=1 Tax=Mesocestoides corti TaxID=53468 RepID=A0A158QUH0_MESCO|nr:unnamed protein product [Mesocestoides corti]
MPFGRTFALSPLQHHLTTKLIQPVICEANSPTASAKPRGPEEKCSPCPPGTKTLNGTHCVSCPTGFISANHNDSCVACPADEVPVFGIKYDTWSRMPPRLATYCLEEDVTCQPWRTNGSSIFVGPGLSSFVHSVLELELLDGFIGPKLNMPFYLDPFIRPLPGTKVVFDFELDCRANCTLTFAVDSLSETLLIQKWNGPLKRMTYTYTPGECEGASFLWLFERWSASGSKWDPASRNDKAIIYSIAVNNTRETGALGCKKCPLGIDGQFCKPCKDGLFYTMTKNATTGVERAECVPCPNGTMVIGDASDIMTVDQACIRCPPGTTAGPASDCVTDLYPEAPSGQNYDFSTLLTKLGDKLIKAVATNSSMEFAKEINSKLTTAGWKADDLGNDYHLFFKTKSTTSACQEGINTIVTLRCGAVSNAAGDSVDASGTALVQIPPNCAVGTCDGCQFHFMIISPLACPICRMQDYNRIEGSCVGGSMKVTLIPPKTCRSEPKFRTVFEESCPLLNTQGKIAVGVVMAIVLLLIFTIFYCYQRNKNSSNGSDGVQQGNECGIPEDDQETDIFHHKPISAIAGGESDSKWNQLTPNSGDLKSGTFGPVIFRQNRTADDSHILTLDDGNAPDTVPI